MRSPVQILVGDCLETLGTLPEQSVQCVVTSPPYWALRDYGVAGQIGLETTLGEYLEKMVKVFREVRRVLRDDGTAWVNMGDCYLSGGGSGRQGNSESSQRANRRHTQETLHRELGNLRPKNMAGVPWRLAFALQDDGWFLRRDIIWHKPNPMPESCRDRPTTAHEYVFLLTKSERYFYNREEAREAVTGNTHARSSAAAQFPAESDRDPNRRRPGVNPKCSGWADGPGSHRALDHARHEREKSASTSKFPKPKQNASFAAACCGSVLEDRNYRSVWTIPTQPFSGAHFATFPESLAARCITAGTRAGDTVLDPFGGSGTTGRVAIGMGRRAVLCELNPDYAEMIRMRTQVTQGLPLQFNS